MPQKIQTINDTTLNLTKCNLSLSISMYLMNDTLYLRLCVYNIYSVKTKDIPRLAQLHLLQWYFIIIIIIIIIFFFIIFFNFIN